MATNKKLPPELVLLKKQLKDLIKERSKKI